MRGFSILLILIALAGCAAPATTPAATNATATSAAAAPVHIEVDGHWAAEAKAYSFDGSGYPLASPPDHLSSARFVVTYSVAQATGPLELRLYAKSGLVWSHELGPSPATLVVPAADFARVGQTQYLNVAPVDGSAAAQVAFHVAGDFVPG